MKGSCTIAAVNLLLTCVISSTVCNSGSKSETLTCNSDRVGFILLHSFRCGRLVTSGQYFMNAFVLTFSHSSLSPLSLPLSCPSPCHPPFLLPPWQMESKKKRRKYSTSSNDSDTTDSKSERNTQMKLACVFFFSLHIWGHNLGLSLTVGDQLCGHHSFLIISYLSLKVRLKVGWSLGLL